MQNRYAGDIGDYGKLGLLRVLQASGLSIGVNWYLTPDEDHNSDGRHVNYLHSEGFRSCDESLWLQLQQIVDSGRREVSALQDRRILEATFFSPALDFSGMSKAERLSYREKWHRSALASLSGTDVVFLDPDNGLVVPSAVETRKENKFVKPKELSGYYRNGSSVIYYQHKARRPDEFYIEQHSLLLQGDGFEGSTSYALKFRTTSQRYYFFAVQPRHKSTIEDAMREMMSTAWSNHFCVL